jgi:hypothetical protein
MKKIPFFYVSTSVNYAVLLNDPNLFIQGLNSHLVKTFNDVKENKTQNYAFGSIFLTESEYNNFIRETIHGKVEKLDRLFQEDTIPEAVINNIQSDIKRVFTLIQGEL